MKFYKDNTNWINGSGHSLLFRSTRSAPSEKVTFRQRFEFHCHPCPFSNTPQSSWTIGFLLSFYPSLYDANQKCNLNFFSYHIEAVTWLILYVNLTGHGTPRLNILLGCVSEGVSAWDQHWISGLTKADWPPWCWWASSNPPRCCVAQKAEEGGICPFLFLLPP